MEPEHEIQQLRVMLARAWVILEEIERRGAVISRPLAHDAWIEIGEWLPAELVLSVQDDYVKRCRARGIEPCPGPREPSRA